MRSALLIGMVYVFAHVLLDAVSWVHGLANLLITPWNPQTGLALAFLLLVGRRYFPALVLACLVSDLLVRPASLNWAASLNFALSFAGACVVSATLLKRLRLSADLQGLRDILLLTGVASLVALCATAVHVGGLAALGLLPVGKFFIGLFRHWIGDVIGIVTTAPAILVLWRQRRDLWSLFKDLAPPLLLMIGVSWVIFGLETTDEFRIFYLLFPPLIWMAVRHGLKGAVVGIVATQATMMGITTFLRYEASTVTALQVLMLALSLTTLLLAAAVEERERAQANLREQQMSMAQMARLSLAGEMASGLAHELNQPLSAIVNYVKAALGLLAQQTALEGGVKETLEKASSQAMRASQIIGRLRDFLHRGEMTREVVAVQELASEAMALIAPTAKRRQVKIATNLPATLAKVAVDRIHIEQVLINLLVNAIEAQEDRAPSEIVIEAKERRDAFVEIAVLDKGPGIAPEIEGRLFEPFASTKNEGMGLGLMICRSIVEAHGGRLWHDDSTRGQTAFRFTLPIAVI